MKGDYPYGEQKVLSQLPNVSFSRFGQRNFVDPANVKPEDKEQASQALKAAQGAVLGGEYDLVVLDEINLAIAWGLVDIEDVVELIKQKPDKVELVLTGRYADARLIELAQLVSDVIRPSLERGMVVICDRYAASTIAYQGYGRGLDLNSIQAINNIATQGLKPDLTILLDIPVQLGLTRKKNTRPDRFESEDIAFHQRVRDGYLKIAAAAPERWLVVDATLPKKEVKRIIWTRVAPLLRK
jgi:dTMP kinase